MRFNDYIKKNKDSNVEKNNDWKFDLAMIVTDARLRAGITQKELAERMGTKQPSVARVENVRTIPSIEFLMKLARAVDAELVLPALNFEPAVMQIPQPEPIIPSQYYQLASTFKFGSSASLHKDIIA